jgi:lipopolysaccharide transport system ATP-binding protein
VARGGRTVLFVSHNMPAVLNLCDRVVLLDGGRTRSAGAPETVIAEYLQAGAGHGAVCWSEDAQAPGDDTIRLRGARILDAGGRASDLVDLRTGFTIEMEYEILRRVRGLQVGFEVLASDGTPVLTSGDTDARNGLEIERQPGRYVTRCTMPGWLLSAGTYSLSLGAHIPCVRACYLVDSALTVTVTRTHGFGSNGDDRRRGVICPLLPWTTTDAQRETNLHIA